MVKIPNNISKMADLLRSGHKMLNIACPICNNPIFKKRNGESFCPTCNREVLIVESKSQQVKSKIKENVVKNKITKNLNIQDHKDVILFLRKVIMEKIEQFSIKLKSETQIDNIERYTKLILDFNDILRKFPHSDT